MRNISHRLFVITAGAAVVAALAFGAVPASAKASGPKLKLSPSKNLNPAGQTIKVSGTGFTPGDSVFVLECIIGDTSGTGSGCNLGNLVPVTPSSKGTFKTTFTVSSGSIGTDGGTCGTSKTDAKACDISAGDAAGNDATSLGISFKIPK